MTKNNSIAALFSPESVAVIGASPNPLSIGNRVLTNLINAGFKGRLHPVHPTSATVCGLKAVKSLDDLDSSVDLVSIAVASPMIEDILHSCGRRGVRAVIIHSAGFAETGPKGVILQARLVQVAREYGIRLVGPNAQGVLFSDPSNPLYASFTFTPMRPGPVSILAVSGGMAELIHDKLRRTGIGIRHYASPGNSSDVDIADLLEYIGEDPGVGAILLHLEGLPPAKRFIEVAARITSRVPILAIKSGRTDDGAVAVRSHTGNLASDDAVSSAVIKRAGIVRVANVNAMIDGAVALMGDRLPNGPRIAIMSNAGGPGIMAVDATQTAGLSVAKLDEETVESLKESQSALAQIGPLVDLAATAGPKALLAAMTAILGDQGVDGLVLSMVTPFFVDSNGLFSAVVEAWNGTSKPVVVNVITNDEFVPAINHLRASGVPVVEYPEQATFVMGILHRVAEARREMARAPVADFNVDKAVTLWKDSKNHGWLSQRECYALLGALDIEFAPIEYVNEANIVSVFERLAGRIVLKVDSPDVLHKAERGGVIADISQTERAVMAISELLTRFGGDTKILAQTFVEGGVEVIVGTSRVEGGGRVVMFGTGGTAVESLGDVVFLATPLKKGDVRQALEKLAVFNSFPDGRNYDLDAATNVIEKLALFAPDDLLEFEVNPLKVRPRGEGVIAVDVRIRSG